METERTGNRGVRVIDEEIRLIPYYEDEETARTALAWYQDEEVCRQTDGEDAEVYTGERLRRMYRFLAAHGQCFFIEYQGRLVGDVTLRFSGEIAIVICKEAQNRGIGRRCIGEMIKLARERGMDKVTAHVFMFNRQSKHVFKLLGFKRVSEEWYEYRLY